MCITYKVKIKNQLNKNIKNLQSDRGGEYKSNKFSKLCANFGIIHQTVTSYTPQENEIAESKNNNLKEMINFMLVSFGSPQNLWGSPINYKSRYPTRNLVLFHSNYGTEDLIPTITSKCVGAL